MTLAESIPKQIYNGNDVATNFSFPHYFWDDTELVVKHKSITGTITTLVLNTDYTVNGADSATGSVDFPKVGSAFSTLATGEKLCIIRDLPKERVTDLAGSYFFDTANEEGDRQVGLIQELLEKINRAPLYDEFNSTAPLTGEEMQALGEGVLDGIIRWDITGNGSAIVTGTYYSVMVMPYAGTIESCTLLADQVGSIVIDIWKDTYTHYPPTVADTITAAAKPTLSSAIKYVDSTLTGWATSFNQGDIFIINVDSASTVVDVTLSLKISKAGS